MPMKRKILGNTENEAVVDENEEENSDQMESSSESSEKDFEEETLVAPRTFISKTYLEATGGLMEQIFRRTRDYLCLGTRKLGQVDLMHFSQQLCIRRMMATIYLLKMEIASTNLFFLVCLKAEKADDLLFVFINSHGLINVLRRVKVTKQW